MIYDRAMTETPAETHFPKDPNEAQRPRSRRWLTGVLVALALVAAAAVLWDTTLKDRIFPRRFGVVEQGAIYRSAQLEANLVGDVLEEHGIRHVINLGVYKPGKPRHDATLAAMNRLDATHVELGLGGDGTGDPQAYVEALTDMRHAASRDEPVLVHCSAGQNRTGGAVALYRVLFDRWSTRRAVEEMRAYTFDPHENTKLLPYLDQHYRFIAEGLVERGELDEIPPLQEKFTDHAE